MKERFGPGSDVTYVSVLDVLCPLGKCVETVEASPILIDESHWSVAGTQKYLPLILQGVLGHDGPQR